MAALFIFTGQVTYCQYKLLHKPIIKPVGQGS